MGRLSSETKKQIELEVSKTVQDYFATATGGSNRQWVKRYKAMIDTFDAYKKVMTRNSDQRFLEGYKACMEIFHKPTEIKK